MATKKSGGSRKNTPRGSNTARKTSKSNSSYTTSRQRQEALAKEARQDRAKRTWKTIGIAFLVLILLAVLGFAGFGIAYVVTDGFGGKVPTAVIMIEDDMYTESADGIAIYPGDEIRVQSLTGATEYDVRIEANAESGDFSFTVGAEPYTWHDLAGQDVTKGFTLTQTDLGFTVDYESFETIIAAVKGADVVIAEGADLSGDMFDLVITMGETEYRFGFGIGLPVSGIELDPDHIIINADKQPVEEPEEPSVGEEYSIGYDLLGGGSATINFKNGTEQFVNSGFAKTGDTVEFTFSDVTENYRVSRVTLQDYNTGSDIHDIVDENGDGTYTFVMPSQDVIVMVYVIPDESDEPAVYGYARDYIRCTVRAVKALEEAAKDRDNPTIGVPETDPDALAALNECKNELTQADEFYTLVQGDSDGIQDDQLAADYYAAYNAATAMTLQIEMGTYTKSSVAEIIADLGDIMERYQ